MDNRDAYVEYLCNNLAGPRLSADPDFLTEEDEDEAIDLKTACCHAEGSGKRKYVLHFQRLDDDSTPQFLVEEERRRCQSFWHFVNEEPILKGLIKEGKFRHESRPQKLDTIGRSFNINDIDDKTLKSGEKRSCKNPHVLKIRENRALVREKFEQLRAKTRQLQVKSKQPVIKCKPPPVKGNLQANLLSDMVHDDLTAEFESMNQYDEDIKTKMLEKSKKVKEQKKNNKNDCTFHPWNETQRLEHPGEYPGEGYWDCDTGEGQVNSVTMNKYSFPDWYKCFEENGEHDMDE